jgi:hypothetical protein
VEENKTAEGELYGEITLKYRRDIRFSPDSPLVFHPRYADADGKRLKAIVRLPDGRFTEMEADRGDLKSALRRDIFAQYSEEEILFFTQRHERMAAARQQTDRRVAEDRRKSQLQEDLYQAKEEATQLLTALLPPDPQALKAIRSSRTKLEVLAWAVRAVERAEKAAEAKER